MKPLDVLALPVRIFWCLSRHVDRIKADNDLRALDLNLVSFGTIMGGGGEDTLKSYRASLREQRGELVIQKQVYSSKDDILKLMEM